MRFFTKIFENEYLKYHTNPIPPNALDPRVWYFIPDGGDPKLQPQIRTQIYKDIDAINGAPGEFAKKIVWDYFLVGPCLSEKSDDRCPLNVYLQINSANLDDVLKEKLLQYVASINGRLASGTLHPIHYIPSVREIDQTRFPAIYHPYTEKWIKKPRFLGEAKTDIDNIANVVPKRKRNKYSLKKGLKKITTV